MKDIINEQITRMKNIRKKNGMNSFRKVLTGKKILNIKEKRKKYIEIKETKKSIINL